MANFWEAGGASGVVAAYEPLGAPDLASSYVNRANPGTYDAAPGVAPTFDAGTGWSFNGTTQYLTTGLVPDVSGQDWTLLVRFASVTGSGNRIAVGMVTTGGNDRALYVQVKSSPNAMQAANGGAGTFVNYVPAMTGGVFGVAGRTAYRDGSAESTLLGSNAGVGTAAPLFVGALNINGSPGQYLPGRVVALAIYDQTLDASEVAAVSAAMAALPTGGSWGGGAVASIVAQMAHHRAVFGG